MGANGEYAVCEDSTKQKSLREKSLVHTYLIAKDVYVDKPKIVLFSYFSFFIQCVYVIRVWNKCNGWLFSPEGDELRYCW